MSWVYPASEAMRTTRLGVVAAFVWAGGGLIVAGGAAALVLGLGLSVVPWLALAGFGLALASLVVAQRFQSAGVLSPLAFLTTVVACWMVAAGVTSAGIPFDGFVGFPLFTVGVAAALVGAIADRWGGAAGTVLGYVAGQGAIVIALAPAVSPLDAIDPAAAAVALIVAVFIALLGVARRRARAASARLDDSRSHNLAAAELQSLRLRSRALVHDTVLGELAALGMARPGPLPSSMSASIRSSLAAVAANVEPLDDVLAPTAAFTELLARFRAVGLRIAVTGDPAAVDGLAPERREPLLSAIEQCLVNVLQHSGVTHAELSIARAEGQVIATVVDEGDGFDETTVPEDRFGVRESIRGRIADLGGSVRILSGRGQGTSVIVSVPDQGVPQ